MPVWAHMIYRKNSPSCKEILEKWIGDENVPVIDLCSFTYESKILEFGLMECVEEGFLI